MGKLMKKIIQNYNLCSSHRNTNANANIGILDSLWFWFFLLFYSYYDIGIYGGDTNMHNMKTYQTYQDEAGIVMEAG